MTAAEIAQIIIGFLSLVATIAVSFCIYWLQRRHEKEMNESEEKQRLQKLTEEANNFLIDHEAERDYLPWCTIASNITKQERHVRKIYTDFSRCSVELQNKILETAGFTIRVIDETKWLSDAFEKLQVDIKQYNLGEQPFLYDNAKYFHRAFKNHRDSEYKRNYKKDLASIYSLSSFDEGKISLGQYIEQYFDHILECRNTELMEWKNPLPPVDYAWNHYNLGSIAEEKMCYWVMELVDNFVINIHNRLKTNWFDSILIDNITDAEAETYEDKYFEILYWMYYTYCYDDKKNVI